MTDFTCPICHHGKTFHVPLRDGGSIEYYASHLRCVEELDRYRDLFRRANAAKRDQRDRARFWHGELVHRIEMHRTGEHGDF